MLAMIVPVTQLCAATRSDPAARAGSHIRKFGDAKPYSHLNFRNNTKNFQFAIVSDRYGDTRAGVFEDALRKVNLLQPEFAMSVGDVLGGPTSDTKYLARMWDELEGLVGQLDMPFFYVTGNHDVGNEMMAKEWERRRGCRYYHFLYQDVLFLVISTDDPFPVQMSPEQEAYFEKVLKDNPNPRWTMVFLHNPTWRLEPTRRQRSSGYPYEHRWSRFDNMLKGRNYTVFAGHTHDYSYERRNGGHEHIVLATTSGGSEMRGARAYGELDEVAWVTMTDEGPRVANLDLSGILPVDIRTAQTMRLVERVSRAAPRGSMIRADGEIFTSGSASVRLHNPADSQANIRIELSVPRPLSVEPAVIDRDMDPGTSESVSVTVTAPEGTQTDSIGAPVSGKYEITLDNVGTTDPLDVDGEFTLGVDRMRPIRPLGGNVTVDGKLDEWGELPLAVATVEPPNIKWRGLADASYRFGVTCDEKNLYLAIQTHDNKLVLDENKPPYQQDGVEFRIDARPDPERSRGRALWNYSDHGMVAVSPAASPGTTMPLLIRPARLADVAQVKAVANSEGIAAEVAIPSSWLDKQQGSSWNAVRVNACMVDYDTTDTRKSKRLWWRPDWRTDRNVVGSGTFEKR
jgi:hypothetical protein